MFEWLVGKSAPVLPTTAPPPKNVNKNKNTAVAGKNYVAIPVAPIEATRLQVVPHPTAPQAGQQGGRRKTKGKGRSRKTKGKAKSRKNRK